MRGARTESPSSCVNMPLPGGNWPCGGHAPPPTRGLFGVEGGWKPALFLKSAHQQRVGNLFSSYRSGHLAVRIVLSSYRAVMVYICGLCSLSCILFLFFARGLHFHTPLSNIADCFSSLAASKARRGMDVWSFPYITVNNDGVTKWRPRDMPAVHKWTSDGTRTMTMHVQ